MTQPHDPHCRELFEKISDYLDKELSEAERLEIEEHIKNCAMCTTCFKTLERTVALCNTLPAKEVPAALSQRLKEIGSFKNR